MRYRYLFAVMLIILCIAGCGAGTGNAAPKKQDTADQMSGGLMNMANPWRESSEAEIEELIGKNIDLPEDISNVYFQVMNEGELCEIDFDYDGLSFTYRMKKTGGREDISGMYYNWDAVDSADFYGYEAYDSRAVTDEETASLFEWYDKENGIMYSLGTTAEDLDGFDIQGVAEKIYPGN